MFCGNYVIMNPNELCIDILQQIWVVTSHSVSVTGTAF